MTSKKSITKFILKNGVECYSLVQKRKVSLNKLYETINILDLEQLQKWVHEYKQDNYSYYYKYYTKLNCVDEVLVLNSNKYQHLYTIRDIVKMDNIIDKILDDKTYQKGFSLYYGRILFSKLFKFKPGLELTYLPLIEIEKENYFKIVMNKIDDYYINIITK